MNTFIILSLFPLSQESLVREVELDPMDGEQTWPTEEELAEAAAAPRHGSLPPSHHPVRASEARRLPRGTSDYQAAWIVAYSEDEVCTVLPWCYFILLPSDSF